MLLQRLMEYTGDSSLIPAMYGKTAVRWIIDLGNDGRFLGLRQAPEENGEDFRGKYMYTPHIGRASGIKPKLLADSGEYVLGKARQDSDPDRIHKCHKAFIELVGKAAGATGEAAVHAVAKFYRNAGVSELPVDKRFDPAHILTFCVEGIFPVDLPSVRSFWGRYAVAGEAGNGKDVMQCLVCGEKKKVSRRLAYKVKRLPGGHGSGTALISANSPAFESYGLKESLIAPTCQDCGEASVKVVNELIEDENCHIAFGPVVYIFWTKERVDFPIVQLLAGPDRDKVKKLFKTVLRNRKSPSRADSTPFYAASFTASGGRAAVRDWVKTTVGAVERNLANWFTGQRLAGHDAGKKPLPMPIKGYINKNKKWTGGLVDDLAPLGRRGRDLESLPPDIFRSLMHSAVFGEPLPRWMLCMAIKMNRVEGGVTRARALLVKMTLLSLKKIKEGEMDNLNWENSDPAYLCGRLLGVLEAIQVKAINPENTMADRFYHVASSAPKSVFGRLIRDIQPCLLKLRREKGPAHEALEERLVALQENIMGYPAVLNLEDQGLFALGYYHQKGEFRANRPVINYTKALPAVAAD